MRNAHSTFDYSSMSNSSLITDTPLGYKKTEVGIIPDDWECVPSKEMISYLGGYAFSSRSAKSDGIRWLKIANVGVNEVKWEAESYLPNSFSENHSDYLLAESDVVMALTRPLLGEKLKVATLSKFDIPALLNQRVAKLSAKNSCNQKYIYYLVQTSDYISAMNLAMAGSDPPNIGTKTLGDILIAIPSSRAEQTAIANALSDVDALIKELEKLIAKKQAIKTATMQQLLTGRTRLPQFAHHPDGRKKGYKPSELGEIPEDWYISNVKQVSLVPMQNGLFYQPLRKGKGVPLINVSDMYKTAPIDVQGLELFDATPAEIKVFKVSYGDLFFTRSSVVPSGIAYCNIFHSERNDVVFDSHLIRVRPNTDLVDPNYLYLNCTSKHARNALIAEAKTATMTTIDQGAINRCPVLIPTKSEQSAIANMLSDMDLEIQALDQHLNKTRQIKQGMMQELLTGRIRLVKPLKEVMYE